MRDYLGRLALHYSGERPIRGNSGVGGRGSDPEAEERLLQIGVYAMGESFNRWRRAEMDKAMGAAAKAEGTTKGGSSGGVSTWHPEHSFRSNHGIAKVHMLVEVRMMDHRHVPAIADVPAQKGIGVSCNYLVFDEDTAKPIAYSRIVGVDKYCVDPKMNRPKSELKEEEDAKNKHQGAAAKDVKFRNCAELPLKALQLGVPCIP